MKFFFFFSKVLFSSFFVLLASTFSLAQITPSDYVTTWKTDNSGVSASNQISIPASGEYTVFYESIPAGVSGTLPETGTFTDNQTLTFPQAGSYRIAIRPTGAVPFHRINFEETGDQGKLLTVEQWGTTVWSSMQYAYSGCGALTTLPEIDVPDLSNVTSLSRAFRTCRLLTGSSNMNNWNLSHVTNLNGTFAGARAFNAPIGNWDVSHVTGMGYLFDGANSFNQPIGNWNISSVTRMQSLFNVATSFNQSLGNWNVANVTAMNRMFEEASSFNQPLGNWNVSSVTRMDNMFGKAVAFNQSLNRWNVSNVSSMENMFRDATAFNQPLSNWTLNANVFMDSFLNNTAMDCGNYNTTLIGWAANPVTPSNVNFGATGIIYGPPAADAHNTLLTSKGWTFSGDSFDAGCTNLQSSANFVTTWKTNNVGFSSSKQIRFSAIGSNFNIIWEEVGNPGNMGIATGTSGINTLTFPTEGTYQMTISPGSGTFTGIQLLIVTDYRKLLEVKQWGDIQWISMVFQFCINLKVTATDIPDLRNVTSMDHMFLGCTSLTNVPGMNAWDVSTVTDMNSMFLGTLGFNEPIGDWDVSNVTDMRNMFNNSGFNQPIGTWDVSNVSDMNAMFQDAVNFNQSLDSWDVSSVTNMGEMFSNANAFNQPIQNWDVGRVTYMNYMFLNAYAFNQPVNSWDVSSVVSMFAMFYSATAFNQSLSKWTVSSGADMSYMLDASGMDCASMGLTLQGWAANPTMPNNISFSAEGVDYGLPAAAALETLRNTKGWTITIGNGVVCDALEVSLISFDAKVSDGTVKLEWATATETDNDYFEIQRSADARNWYAIGRNEGAGTMKSVRHYSFIDSNPVDGVSYYRLKIVDLAGKADYSNVRAVDLKTVPTLSVYPNPATNSVTVSGKGKGFLKIYNLSGRQLMQREVKVDKTVIPVSGLPAGAYIIKSEDGWNAKFIKQ